MGLVGQVGFLGLVFLVGFVGFVCPVGLRNSQKIPKAVLLSASLKLSAPQMTDETVKLKISLIFFVTEWTNLCQ